MLGLPKSTEFNKRIPKQKFYENLSVTPAIKKAFTEQIKIIYWRNKLAATTLNIASGEQVTEIEVFEVKLTSPSLDENVLRLIDREIPYHILFLLEWDRKYRAVMGYKEAVVPGKTAFKVDRYYYTKWMNETELPLRLEGLALDAVWENLIMQVGGIELEHGNSLNEQIALEDLKAKLVKDIINFQNKARKEKQPNKKFELVTKAKELKKELSELEMQVKDGTVYD